MGSKMHMKFSFQSKAKAFKQACINDLVIRDLMKLPENRKCINCNSPAPQYVCTTFSTFVCLTCSGIHREFSHRVKSVSMANFTPEEVAALQAGGNQRAEKVYLSRWNYQRRPAHDGSDVQKLRDFIKEAYVEGSYSNNQENFDKSPKVLKSDDMSANRNSNCFQEISSVYGEELLGNPINRRNSASHEAVSNKHLHDKQHVKNTSDGKKLSRHLEELNSISDQLREVIVPLELGDSTNMYSCDSSHLQEETVYSSGPGSENTGQTEKVKDNVGVFTESKAENEPHIHGATPTTQSASSEGETSFSRKFQATVLKLMEHKKGSATGSKLVSEPPIPDGVQALQICQPSGEQMMTSSDNWASFDQPVQGKMCPPLNSSNLEYYSSVSTNQWMSESNPVIVDSLAPVSPNWGMTEPSKRQLSSVSGCGQDLRHSMVHGVPYQPPTASTASNNRKKELTNSEALFAATFSSFSWSQAPSSDESGKRIPLVSLQEKQNSLEPLRSKNPFDVSIETTDFQVCMPAQDEQIAHSTRLLHSSSNLCTSSQFFPTPSSPYREIPSKGEFYAEMPSTCTYTRPPQCSPLSARFVGHEHNENDGYWHSNSPFHHRLPARSKSFSYRGNPFA